MHTFLNDLRIAFRSFRSAPAFAMLVIATLSIGVGATTAIFSAVNDGFFRPLPLRQPERLVMLFVDNTERGWERVHAAPANVMDWRDRVNSFQDVAHYSDFTSSAAVIGEGPPQQAKIGSVSGNLFSVIGVEPHLGRTFTMEETWAGGEPIAMLRHSAWRRLFNSDPQIVGKSIRIDEVSHRVVGVLPASLPKTLTDADIWTPYAWPAELRAATWFRQAHVSRAVARLEDEVTLEQARKELTAVGAQLQLEHPQLNRGMNAGMEPLQTFLTGDKRVPLLFLFGAVIVLQLMACANVANLMLVRGLGRTAEFAVRAAMGAGRARLVAQTLAESFALTSVGSVLGVGLAALGLRAMAVIAPEGLAVQTLVPDWRVALFVLVLMATSTLIFGLLPAWIIARKDAVVSLANRSRAGSATHLQARLTSGLTALQVGLAVVLIAGAGLLLQSLNALRSVDSGINASQTLTFEVTPPKGNYPNGESRTVFALALQEKLRSLPGVVNVGVTSVLPFMGGGWTSDFKVEGTEADEFGVDVKHRSATPQYFETMEIPVLDGALFSSLLGPDQLVPVVVNKAFADRYFPDESPAGQRIAFDRAPDEDSYWYPIAAVVGNERLSANQDPVPEIISHLRADTPRTLRFVIRTSGAPIGVLPEASSTLRALDPGIPIVAVRTMDEVVDHALLSERFLMILLVAFAASALTLTAVGVYGVVAQGARTRRREIGIRVALGAQKPMLFALLLKRAAFVVSAGLAVGLATALVAGRFVESLLFEVAANDPFVLAASGCILAVIALGSCYVPARRALAADPADLLIDQ